MDASAVKGSAWSLTERVLALDVACVPCVGTASGETNLDVATYDIWQKHFLE
jgi:hypothetical protein